jgi:hypothetical protein
MKLLANAGAYPEVIQANLQCCGITRFNNLFSNKQKNMTKKDCNNCHGLT